MLWLALSSERAVADLSDSEAALSITLPRVFTGVGAGMQTRGYTFSLESARSLTHLGLYDYSSIGVLAVERQVGVWNTAGTLVASVTIPAGAINDGGPAEAAFFYGELATPAILAAGEIYTAGVWYAVNNDPGIAMMIDFTTLPGFSYLETVETGPPGGAFAKPTIVRTDRLNAYIGPNLRFATAPPTVTEFKITEIIYTGGESPSVSFTFNSLPGRNYAIFASTAMLPSGELGGWIGLDDSYPSQGAKTTYTDSLEMISGPRVFYQVRELPPG